MKWILRATLLVGLIWAGYWVYKNHGSVPASTWVAGGLCLAVLVVWVIREIYTRTNYRTYSYPRQKFPYEIVHKTVRYRIDAGGVLRFSRTVRIRSNIDGLEYYQDKFLWTAGPITLPTPADGCVSTTEMHKAGIWTFFSTQLSHPINRGREHEFTVEWPAISNWRQSSPFVSSSTDEPTQRLTFEVDLGMTTNNDPVFVEQLRSIESPAAFKIEAAQFKGGRYEWVITKPRLYRHYRLRWEWPGHGAPQPMPATSDDRTHQEVSQ